MEHQLNEEFMAHVSVNGRLYEIELVDIGTDSEKLYINNVYCSNFDPSIFGEWLHKRSIWIENVMVHMIQVKGQWTLEVERLSDGKTPLDMQKRIPQYDGPISQMRESTEYLRNSDEDRVRQFRSRWGKNILSVVMLMYTICMFVVNDYQADAMFAVVLGGIIVTEFYFFKVETAHV